MILSSLPSKGGVFIDVGANVGIFTFWAALKMRRHGGVIHVIEPQYELAWVFTFLRSLFRKVTIVVNHIVLSDSQGVLILERRSVGSGGASVRHGMDEKVREELALSVESRTLDGYALGQDVHRVDTVKIDVEGHELAVILGGLDTIQQFRPLILLESDPGSRDFKMIVSLLTGLGYEGRLLVSGRLLEIGFDTDFSSDGKVLRDFVFYPEKRA